MKHPSPYTPANSLGFLSTRFSRTLLKRINLALTRADLGITAQQYAFLVQLWEQNGLPQGVLAEKTQRDKTTMARLAGNLEGADLIERLPSAEDSRERLVYLTDRGKELMDRATALVQEILVHAQKGIDPGELDVCREVLRRACLNLLK